MYSLLLKCCNKPTDVEILALKSVNILAVASTKSNLLSNEVLSALYWDALNTNKDALTISNDCEVAIYDAETSNKDWETKFKLSEVALYDAVIDAVKSFTLLLCCSKLSNLLSYTAAVLFNVPIDCDTLALNCVTSILSTLPLKEPVIELI